MHSDSDHHPGGRETFTETCWTDVYSAARRDEQGAEQALERLCRTYWPPVYAYLRRKQLSPEDAGDVAQDFFQLLLERNLPGLADPERGQFRHFLLGALRNFLGHWRERGRAAKRGGGTKVISLEALAAAGQMPDLEGGLSAEEVYDRRWAEAMLSGALERLRSEHESSGRGRLFAELAPYLWGSKSGRPMSDVAAQLDLNENSLRVALSRMKLRYRELIRSEVARTVSDRMEVDAELRYLMRLLGS